MQMVFLLHGLQDMVWEEKRYGRDRGVRSEEFWWATEGTCVVWQIAFWKDWQTVFPFLRLSGLTHQIKLLEKVSSFWWLSKSGANNSMCGQMEVKSPVWVFSSDSPLLIPGYTGVLPGFQTLLPKTVYRVCAICVYRTNRRASTP